MADKTIKRTEVADFLVSAPLYQSVVLTIERPSESFTGIDGRPMAVYNKRETPKWHLPQQVKKHGGRCEPYIAWERTTDAYVLPGSVHDIRYQCKACEQNPNCPECCSTTFRRSAVRNMEQAGVPRSVAMKI